MLGCGTECVPCTRPRLVRMVTSNNWSMHDLILVDCELPCRRLHAFRGFLTSPMLICIAPEFHLVIQAGSNGEVYNMAIRGGNLGGSDGIDVWGVLAFCSSAHIANNSDSSPAHSTYRHQLLDPRHRSNEPRRVRDRQVPREQHPSRTNLVQPIRRLCHRFPRDGHGDLKRVVQEHLHERG